MLAGQLKVSALPIVLAFAFFVLLTTDAKEPPAASASPYDKLPVEIPQLPAEIASAAYNTQRLISSKQSFGCDTVWKNASADNDVLACLQNADRIKGHWKGMAVLVANVVLFVILFVGFPLVYVVTLCCLTCGKPKTRHGTQTARCCIWMWIVYALLWGVAVFVFVTLGTSIVLSAIPRLADDVLDGPVDYFNSTAENVLNFMSNWSTGERQPLPQADVDLTPFTDVQNQIRDILAKSRKFFFTHVESFAMATYAVGSVGFVLVLLILPFAFFHCCIPCFPALLACGYWILGSVFALLGVVVNLLSFAFSATCGELELQYQRQPGVFQWYVVPLAKSKYDFEALNEMVRETEVKFARESCAKLLNACDNKPEPNVSSVSGSALGAAVSAFAAVTSDTSALEQAAASGGVSVPNDAPTSSTVIKEASFQNVPASIPSIPAAPPTSASSSPTAKAPATGNNIPGVEVSKIDISKMNSTELRKAAALVSGKSAKDSKSGLNGANGADLIARLGVEGLPPGIDLTKLAAGLPKDMELKLPENFDPNNIPAEVAKFVKENLNNLSDFKPLRCGMNITEASQCTDFATMANVLFTTTIKGLTGVCPDKGKPCSVVECAYNCTDSTIVGIARQALEAALLARNASIAFSFARPLLEWNFVIDKLAGSLETCNDFQTGTRILGIGFLLGTVTFILGIYIMLRGSCIWRSTPTKYRS